MEYSEKEIERWKELFKPLYEEELLDKDVIGMANNLVRYCEILIEIDRDLKKTIPKQFP